MTVADLLARLDGVKRAGEGWTARCPAHKDRRASLSIGIGEDGAVLVHCHAGCQPDAVVAAVGSELRDLFPSTNDGQRSEVVATYPYTDEAGALLFEVVRFAPKDFRQRRPDGAGGWTWKLGDVRRVLYRLPDVVEAATAGRTVLIAEGEKDADRLAGLGFTATTNPGGAGKWRDAYAESLRGAHVVILPDNDDPGRAHALDVARSVHAVARSVRVLALPGLSRKADASDWLDAGGTREQLERLARQAPEWTPETEEPAPRKLPAPMGVAELLAADEPEEEWLAEGLIPAAGNVLIAGHPKTFKTMFLLDLAVSLASGTPFLHRFHVPERRRVGVVLMEDAAHRTRRRLQRLCEGRGVALEELAGRLHFWHRPPLRLTDATVVELGQYADELDLDLLAVDSWAYVAGGDSDDADDVTPQLQALSHARTLRPGLTVQLTHHARKETGDREGTRLTDIIRNSSAFGAWYDAGLVLARRDEQSPVTVRAELRDYATPEPFAFSVEDEHPATPENGHRSGGWMRIRVSDQRPEVVDSMAAAEKLVPAVRDFLTAHPGASKSQLRNGIEARHSDTIAAFEVLVAAGEARYEEPARRGQAGRCHLIATPRPTASDRVPDALLAGGATASPNLTPPYKGGQDGTHPALSHSDARNPRDAVHDPDFECARGCGQPVGSRGITCAACRYGGGP